MPRLDRQVVIAGLIALAGTAFVMTHSIAGDGARDAKIQRDVKIQTDNVVVARAAAAAPTIATTLDPAQDSDAATVIAGSEPDPESFDRAGLESWWSRYQKAHPAR